ncbi:hypothetical protein AZ66_29090 [Paenibacillus sp. E194]|nr:hypothetical protein AZ66_29090 [Paenibacillus sp. E194]
MWKTYCFYINYKARSVNERMMVIKLFVFQPYTAGHDDEGLFQSVVSWLLGSLFCGFNYGMYICPKQAKRI